MRKKIFLALVAIAFMGCTANSFKPSSLKKAAKTKALKGKSRVQLTSFDDFFMKFKSDSVYQVAHVMFPLKIIITDDDSDSIRYVNKAAWVYTKFLKGKDDIFKKSVLSKSDVKIEHMVEDTGISINYYFAYINNDWQLVLFKDDSD
ncbi:DUF4348 domain-containing protein [Inquilinus sp. KBS0705]|nr:DUF4348 domain-containing protein [Inquilinus sp. KBS0705]